MEGRLLALVRIQREAEILNNEATESAPTTVLISGTRTKLRLI